MKWIDNPGYLKRWFVFTIVAINLPDAGEGAKKSGYNN
jgi:hypothetical protein